jgi:hypothetical protein
MALLAWAAGIALAGPRALALLAPALAAAGAALSPIRTSPQAIELLAYLPLLLPAAFVGGVTPWWRLFAGAALAVAAGWGIPGYGALAAPLLVLAMSLRRSGNLAALQGFWASCLLMATALLAGFPWLHRKPFSEVLSFFHLDPGWPAAAVVVAVTALLLGFLRLSAGRGRILRPADLLAIAIALALVTHVPALGSRELLAGRPMTLDRGHRSWRHGLEAASIRSLVLDSSVANSARLPRGTPVATVRLHGAEGGVKRWTLRLGRHTGEWAARSPGLPESVRTAAPSPWLCWVEGGGRFFGQRYRTVLELDEATAVDGLTIARHRALPDDVSLSLFHVEVRP